MEWRCSCPNEGGHRIDERTACQIQFLHSLPLSLICVQSHTRDYVCTSNPAQTRAFYTCHTCKKDTMRIGYPQCSPFWVACVTHSYPILSNKGGCLCKKHKPEFSAQSSWVQCSVYHRTLGECLFSTFSLYTDKKPRHTRKRVCERRIFPNTRKLLTCPIRHRLLPFKGVIWNHKRQDSCREWQKETLGRNPWIRKNLTLTDNTPRCRLLFSEPTCLLLRRQWMVTNLYRALSSQTKSSHLSLSLLSSRYTNFASAAAEKWRESRAPLNKIAPSGMNTAH